MRRVDPNCKLCTIEPGSARNVTVNPRLLCLRHQPAMPAIVPRKRSKPDTTF
jgi:hypothetical protein